MTPTQRPHQGREESPTDSIQAPKPVGCTCSYVGGRHWVTDVSCPADHTTPTISVNDVKGHHDIHRPPLPPDITGVYWTDTGWTECRDHLLDWGWPASITASNEPTGVALYGPVECDACAEAMEMAANDALCI